MKSSNDNAPKTGFQYDLAQAYLEMARAFHHAPILGRKSDSPEEVTMTHNTMFALLAQSYVFSFMSVTAFVNGCLWKSWIKPHSLLKQKYPKAKDFTHLLRSDLREPKDCIKELCIQLKLPPLQSAEPKLWDDLLNVVKFTRDFLMHPRPDSKEFNTVIGHAVQKRSWEFPAKVAERTIRYFYSNQKKQPPTWLKENLEFDFSGIRALSVSRRL